MASKQPSLWNRLTGVFRKSHSDANSPPDLPTAGDDGLLLEPAEYPDPVGGDGEPAAERSGNPLTRWTRREQTLTRLQEGYERINQVIEEIQKHLAQQGERTDRICTALETLARTMGDVPTLGRQQAQTLEAMAGHIEAGNARMQQLVDSVGDIPKAARTQTETLNGIKRQLEMTGEQHLVTGQTMEKLSTAITALGEVNTTQLESLRQMNTKADDQTDRLTKLVARQNKRFVMLFIVTIVLAVGAITAAVLSLVLRHSG